MLVWDATCPDTLAPSYSTLAVREAGAVADEAERKKKVKYCMPTWRTVIINPRRACARVIVLVLSVCLYVCFPYSGTSRNQAYKQQYQRIQRNTDMKFKKGFFFKTLRSEVMASFTHLE